MDRIADKKSIAHITFSFTRDHAADIIIALLNFQVSFFRQVVLVVVDNAADEDLLKLIDEKVVVLMLNRAPSSRSAMPAQRLNRILHLYHPDIVHAHHERVLSMMDYPGKKKLLSVHYQDGTSEAGGRYTRVIPSLPEVEIGRAALGMDHSPYTIVKNGIDTSKVRNRWMGNFKMPLRIIQIGRLLHAVKGQHLLLQALHHIKLNGFTEFEVHFVGEGPSKGILEAMAAQLGLSAHCSFLGFKSSAWVYDNLCEYGLLVHPSLEDESGFVIAEAMAANVLCLVADKPAFMQLINHGQMGYYFEHDNVASFAGAIMNVVKTCRNSLQQMREDAREHIVKNYSMHAVNETYLSLYDAG